MDSPSLHLQMIGRVTRRHPVNSEGTASNGRAVTDRVEALAAKADVTVSAIQAIADKARHNLRVLESCPYHEFEQNPHTAILRSITHQRYVCRTCGGSIDADAYRWFQLGRKPRP